jgi:molybdopterin-guanine dinucleotide biosynthesis protein
MVKATSVFTPTDVPTVTNVERQTKNFEEELRRALPKMIVSISGPSKSGKTVLVTKVVSRDNLIHLYGASIKTASDLWRNVIAWMGGPIEVTETSASKRAGTMSATAGGKAGIPLVAQGSAAVTAAGTIESSAQATKKLALNDLDTVVAEIGGSDFVVFVDDFHYIEAGAREEIGRQIKAAAERGVRVCTASVPHRSDDVVRSNTELRASDRCRHDLLVKKRTGGDCLSRVSRAQR